jgi:hypothetical protein
VRAPRCMPMRARAALTRNSPRAGFWRNPSLLPGRARKSRRAPSVGSPRMRVARATCKEASVAPIRRSPRPSYASFRPSVLPPYMVLRERKDATAGGLLPFRRHQATASLFTASLAARIRRAINGEVCSLRGYLWRLPTTALQYLSREPEVHTVGIFARAQERT